jgi:hypothetical protein
MVTLCLSTKDYANHQFQLRSGFWHHNRLVSGPETWWDSRAPLEWRRVTSRLHREGYPRRKGAECPNLLKPRIEGKHWVSGRISRSQIRHDENFLSEKQVYISIENVSIMGDETTNIVLEHLNPARICYHMSYRLRDQCCWTDILLLRGIQPLFL